MPKHKILNLVIALSLSLSILPTPAEAYNQSAAVGYLQAGSQDEWSVMALASSNALAGVSLEFLKSDPGNAPTDLEKRILAIVAAGLDPQTFGQVNFVQKLAATFDGTEIDPAAGLLNDDIFGLLAFAAAGTNQSIQSQLKSFIKQNQNSDGGWSYAKAPSSSDSNDTAMAIMALLASGENAGSLSQAYAYLGTTQTATGYSFDTASGYGPDAASTAWVISALLAGGQNRPQEAVQYLESLQKSDGSFSWQTGGSSSTLMTAYAVIALNNDSYPVRGNSLPYSTPYGTPYATPYPYPYPTPQGGGLPQFGTIILDNAQNLIFQGTLTFNSVSVTDNLGQVYNFQQPMAIGTVTEGAKVGGFSYSIKNTSLGLFVECIAGLCPSGNKGWLYAVNGSKPNVGAAEYVLTSNDQVLWFYGSPTDPIPPPPPPPPPSQTSASVNLSTNITGSVLPPPAANLTASKTQIRLGESVNLSWTTQNTAAVLSSSPNNWAMERLFGAITLQPSQTTTYTMIIFGPGGTREFSLTVNVDTTPHIVFGIGTSEVNFGDLSPGQTSAVQSVRLINSGGTHLTISATLQNSDGVYQQGLYLNNALWQNYQTELDAYFAKTVNLALQIPQNYQGSGQKTGTLIFWAAPK